MLWVMPLCKCLTPLSKDVGSKSSATGCNSYQNAYSTCSDQLLITIFSALDSDREKFEEIITRTLLLQPRAQGLPRHFQNHRGEDHGNEVAAAQPRFQGFAKL